jgi:hypothetical protein
MRRFTVHLCQDASFPIKSFEICFNTNKEAMYYALDKLLEASKKYKRMLLTGCNGKVLLNVKR